MPRYFGKTALLPLRSILERAGYTVAWDARAEGAAFSSEASGDYLLDIDTGVLTLDGSPVWTDPNAVVLEGTTYVSAALFDHVDHVSASWDGATNTAVVTTDAPRDNVYCYDLGEGTLTPGNAGDPLSDAGRDRRAGGGELSGGDLPARVPSRPLGGGERYDLGFSYLVTSCGRGVSGHSMTWPHYILLKMESPAAVSCTVQVVEQQSALLKRAIEGESGISPATSKTRAIWTM